MIATGRIPDHTLTRLCNDCATAFSYSIDLEISQLFTVFDSYCKSSGSASASFEVGLGFGPGPVHFR